MWRCDECFFDLCIQCHQSKLQQVALPVDAASSAPGEVEAIDPVEADRGVNSTRSPSPDMIAAPALEGEALREHILKHHRPRDRVNCKVCRLAGLAMAGVPGSPR